MSFSESGYSFSSIDRLKSSVSIGERNGVRSLITAGLILYISFALFRFISFIVLMIIFSVVCCSVNVGMFVLWLRLSSSMPFIMIKNLALLVFGTYLVIAAAPFGPDNLSQTESNAVQQTLDKFFTLFKASCSDWPSVFTEFGIFNHPPPIGTVRGLLGLEKFCTTVQAISKVQEMRQDGPFTFVATAANHTRLDVVIPAVYINDAPFVKTMLLVFRLSQVAPSYSIEEVSEVLTSTQSNFSWPAN